MAFDRYFGFNTTQAQTLEALLNSDDAAEIAALAAEVANLNAWATALATKLNAQFAVANAETTLPFTPALAVDYDTNPQA